MLKAVYAVSFPQSRNSAQAQVNGTIVIVRVKQNDGVSRSQLLTFEMLDYERLWITAGPVGGGIAAGVGGRAPDEIAGANC